MRIYTDNSLAMAERLNTLAYAQQITGAAQNSAPLGHNFNPRSVSLDIRTPEELAAVNEFLLTLGRDVSVGGQRNQSQNSSNSANSTGFSAESYFDAVSLSQLGLTGMPGMPGSGSNYPNDNGYSSTSSHQSFPSNSYDPSVSRSTHSSVHPVQYGPMYPSLSDTSTMAYSSANDYSPHVRQQQQQQQQARRISNKYTPSMPVSNSNYATQQQHYQHPTPPLDSGSPHSNHSSPSQINLSMPNNTSFDYIRGSRGAPPVAHLSPVDFSGKSMHTIRLQQSAPGSHPPDVPEPMEPKLTTGIHRGPPAKLTSSSVSTTTKSGPLYPLLTSGDIQYKLPPLNHRYRSPSPAMSRESTPSSTQSSPAPQVTVLPSLHYITSPPPVRTASESSDDLAKKIGRIELDNRTKQISPDQRRQHAELIRNLLVTINMDFKKRHGVPAPAPPPPLRLIKRETESAKMSENEISRDVEMATA